MRGNINMGYINRDRDNIIYEKRNLRMYVWMSFCLCPKRSFKICSKESNKKYIHIYVNCDDIYYCIRSEKKYGSILGKLKEMERNFENKLYTIHELLDITENKN